MSDRILDKAALSALALNFSKQAGINIGIFNRNGEELFASEGTSFLRSEVSACIARLGSQGVENVIDSPVSAVAMRGSRGDLLGVWLVKSQYEEESQNMDSILGLIEAFVSTYIKEREIAVNMTGRVEEFERTGEDLSKELKQTEIITEILERVESEEDFENVVYEILGLCGDYLGLSNAFILQMDADDGMAHILTEWKSDGAGSLVSNFSDIEIERIPFADGLSYTVSSDSRMPDVFRNFMRDHDMSAGIFLPIFLNDVNVMYLCATMESVPRHWLLSEAGFLNDVKRVISTILAKRITKNSLASSYAVVESVLENAGCGICVISSDGSSFLYTNQRFNTLFSDISDRQKLERRIKQIPEKMTQIREYEVENAGIYVSIELNMINWVDSTMARLCTFVDITETKMFEERIEKQANIDTLTGIYNRVFFNKELSELLSAPHRPGNIICMNIDGFNDVNNSLGNEAGDNILASVAKFLTKLSGDNVCVYRLGADEFGIIIKDREIDDPWRIADSIVRRFEMPWQLPYSDCYLMVSVGMAGFPEDGDDLYSIIKSTGLALSEARRSLGSLTRYSREMDEMEKARVTIRAALRDEVKSGYPGFEKEVAECIFVLGEDDFRTGFIYHMDWMLESRLNLLRVLPVAEREKLDSRMIDYFIDEAVGALRDRNDFGYPDCMMGVPLDISELARHDIVSSIKRSLESHSASAGKLVICLVGSIYGRDEIIRDACEDIREIGVHIAYMHPYTEGIPRDILAVIPDI